MCAQCNRGTRFTASVQQHATYTTYTGDVSRRSSLERGPRR